MKLTTINQIVEAILSQTQSDIKLPNEDVREATFKRIANEATIILKTALICEDKGIDEAMKYYNGTHTEDEYQDFRTSVVGYDISLCKDCWCMTHTINGKCGKCKAKKEERLIDRLAELYDMAKPPIAETLKIGEHSDFEFFILWFSSHPNAYIKIPKSHPYYKKDYREIDNKYLVHGGFTFSGKDLDKRYGLSEGWYLGWDYAHCTDFINLPGYCLDGIKRRVEDIEKDCKEVIDKIIKEAK